MLCLNVVTVFGTLQWPIAWFQAPATSNQASATNKLEIALQVQTNERCRALRDTRQLLQHAHL